MTDSLEIEIKLPAEDPEDATRRLEAAGALPIRSRILEDNHILDFPDGRLQERRVMLRVRLEGASALLTVKERTDGPSGYKTRREQETRVDDGSRLLATLRSAGLVTAYRYQKYRTVYRLGDVIATVDETPLGCFIELEGEPDAIDACAERLGWGRGDYIDLSYRELQIQRLRSEGIEIEPTALLFDPEASR